MLISKEKSGSAAPLRKAPTSDSPMLLRRTAARSTVALESPPASPRISADAARSARAGRRHPPPGRHRTRELLHLLF